MTTSNERREKILEILHTSELCISGSKLAEKLNVSRQVIVQDITILRHEGIDIIATHRGYKVSKDEMYQRILKVAHDYDDIEKELNAIVDLGAIVKDVFITHKVYGDISVQLNISSRRDVKKLIRNIETANSKPLNHLTGGTHYHTVKATSISILDELEAQLNELGFIVV